MNLIIAFIASFFLISQSADLETARAKFPSAHLSVQNADSFLRLAEKGSGSTMNGYKAAAKIVKAKFAKGEGRKKIIAAGVTALESTIKNDPNNTELRLIRLSVQENLPKFIKYDKNIPEDKAFLLKNFSDQNTGLKTYIKKFAMNSKSLTPAEKLKLR